MAHPTVRKEERACSSPSSSSSSIARPYMLHRVILLLLLPAGFSLSACSAQGDLASDALALLTFINNLTIGASGSRAQLSSWNSSSTGSVCSSWWGVFCLNASAQQPRRVISLRLPGKSLYGRIAPDTLSRLDALQTLSLRSNKLYGEFPADFAALPTLQRLFLQGNDFSGSLPLDFSQWPLLSQLDLSSNHFSGSIPSSLATLTHLRNLYLQSNLLSGAIPPLDIPSLDVFNVSDNNLNGSVPATLGRFPSSSFTGNDDLCGPPLAECRSGSHLKKLSTRAIVGIVCGAVAATLLVLLLLLLLWKWVVRRRGPRQRSIERSTEELGTRGAGAGAGAAAPLPPSGAAETREPWQIPGGGGGEEEQQQQSKLVFLAEEKRLFELEDLLRASAEVLGKGSLGTSYKAVLEDGLIVTVKRLRDMDDSRREEYRQRLQAMGGLQHPNVVPLRAYYFDSEESLLVYDFMQNGSLAVLLHGSRDTGFNPLDWEVRVMIAATSAKGLAFIHAHNMVHGNIKSSNVLLKSNLEACISDYGLSPLLHFSRGTLKSMGYIAPEVTDPCNITPKADVYSFGVLLLELLTGKAPMVPTSSAPRPSLSATPAGLPSMSPVRIDDPVDLPRWVQSVVREEWTAEVFDPALIHSGQTFNEEEMVQLLQVAMACVSSSPDQRPSMPDVVQMIDSIRRATDDDKSSDSNTEQYHASTSAQP